MKQVVTLKRLHTKKRITLKLAKKWRDFFGEPEIIGSWIIAARSANGKTSLAVQLAKELTKTKKVLYNSIEEGDSKSLSDACYRVGLHEGNKNFAITSDSVSELTERLKMKKSYDVIFIDSIQYFRMSYDRYIELKNTFPKKQFIYISHMEGNKPVGSVARDIYYDSFIKIVVRNFVATAQSRYGGGELFVVSEEKANEH